MHLNDVHDSTNTTVLSVPSSLRYLVKAMRPHHWVKNIVVAAAPFFALAFETDVLARVSVAFVVFSLTCSGFYLINDLFDREADRRHPVKRHRPIAAGLVSAPMAAATAVTLLLGSLVVGFFTAPLLGVTLTAYMLLQIGYNAGLKHEPILDIMLIAGGFVLRALGGAVAAGVPVSDWFILCVGLLAFFLGLEKRKAELKSLGSEEKTRSVLRQYSMAWLSRMENVVTASALMAYALWTIKGAETTWMLTTLPFVAYAIFKYQYLSEQGKGESPEMTLLKDPGMVLTFVLWVMTALAVLLYGQGG